MRTLLFEPLIILVVMVLSTMVTYGLDGVVQKYEDNLRIIEIRETDKYNQTRRDLMLEQLENEKAR